MRSLFIIGLMVLVSSMSYADLTIDNFFQNDSSQLRLQNQLDELKQDNEKLRDQISELIIKDGLERVYYRENLSFYSQLTTGALTIIGGVFVGLFGFGLLFSIPRRMKKMVNKSEDRTSKYIGDLENKARKLDLLTGYQNAQILFLSAKIDLQDKRISQAMKQCWESAEIYMGIDKTPEAIKSLRLITLTLEDTENIEEIGLDQALALKRTIRETDISKFNKEGLDLVETIEQELQKYNSQAN